MFWGAFSIETDRPHRTTESLGQHSVDAKKDFSDMTKNSVERKIPKESQISVSSVIASLSVTFFRFGVFRGNNNDLKLAIL